VENYLNIFTLLEPQEVENIMLAHKVGSILLSFRSRMVTYGGQSEPEMRSAQRSLAEEVTEMIHGGATSRFII
jgi:tyrosyl-tRNA synthetase